MASDNCKTKWSYLVAGLLGAGATVAAGSGYAQSASGSTPQNGQEVSETSLEEVIVTAERRAQDLQKTAVSISVRSGKDLREQGKLTLGQMLEDVPGVTGGTAPGASGAGTDTGSTGVFIRGIGANNPLAGSITSPVPATASYVDGVYSGIGGDYDINRVEVLRGPQGTLYGRSATAGVIASHTVNPTLSEYNGNAEVVAGDYALRQYSGAVNIPLGDSVAVRASGMRFTRDGYYAPKGGAVAETAGRVKLLYQPTANITALLGAALQNNDTHTGERPGTLPNKLQPNTVVYQPNQPLGTGKDKFRQYWGQFDWNLGPATLTYLPAFRSWSQDALAYNSNLQLQIATPYDHFTTQEVRLASNDDARLRWQAGALYYNNGVRNSIININTTFNSSSKTSTQKTTVGVGVFGEATFSFTDTLRLTAGLRHDRTDMKINVTRTTSAGATTSLPADQSTPAFDNTTYKLRLETDVTPDNMVYASVSTGFLPGDISFVTVSTLPPVITTTLKPGLYSSETLTSYEIGAKNRFFDRKLLVNGDVFYYRYGGFQLGGVNIAPDTYVTLTAPARVKGAEVEVTFQPTHSDRIAFNYQYVDGRFVDRPASFTTSVVKERISNIAPVAGSLSYLHEFTLPRNQTLSFNFDLLYRSGRDLAPITAAVQQGGYGPLLQVDSQYFGNFNATWTFGPQRTLTAFVRNVSDNRYKTSANVVLPGPPPAPQTVDTFASQSDPRTIGVVLHVGF